MTGNRRFGTHQHLFRGDGRVLPRGFPVAQSQILSYPVFTCPSHGIDVYIKNICTSKGEIGIQKNDMRGVGTQHVKWDETFFEKVFSEV